MERKSGTSAVVTAAEVKAALGKARALSSEEEKALRMRYGAKAEDAPLPSASGGNEELEDELMVIQMQLFRAWKQHLAAKNGMRVEPAASRTKDKIVRALRKKR